MTERTGQLDGVLGRLGDLVRGGTGTLILNAGSLFGGTLA